MSDYKITLDQVLGVYRKVLPVSSIFMSGFFQRTVPTQDGTLGIDRHGNFYYCPEWCEKWLTNPARFEDGAMHEMMHPVIGDLAGEYSELMNVAEDIVINAMLFNLKFARCELMEAFYDKVQGPQCLLRPYSKPEPKVKGLYERMYHSNSPAPGPIEVAHALRLLYPSFPMPVLIGTHGMGRPTKTKDGEDINPDDFSLPGGVIGEVADDLAEYAGSQGGRGGILGQHHIKILETRATLREEMIQQFAVRDKINKLRRSFEKGEPEESIIPSHIGRTEAALLGMDHMPLHYQIPTEVEDTAGIHVFIDVSGSVWHALPKLLGVLKALRDKIEAVYQFSNGEVALSSIAQMIKGGEAEITTGGGTEFDCVLEQCFKAGITKALVFTDGYSDVNQDLAKRAKKEIDTIGVVYFGVMTNKENWFQQHYKVGFDLDELVRTSA